MNAREAEKEVRKVISLLKSIRKSQNVSHERLVEKTGVSRGAISTTESGKSSPTLKTCLRLCDGLDVKLSDLLREIGQ